MTIKNLSKQFERSLLVSPHYDDIALSIGGIISLGYFSNSTLLTVFTKSKFALHYEFGGIEKKTSEKRRIENEHYCSFVELKKIDCSFSDTTLRGYKDLEGIYQVDNPKIDPIFGSVKRKLKNEIKQNSFNNIICPLGIGNHVDHLIVTNAIEEIVEEIDLDVFFYEDLPYAGLISLESIDDFIYRKKLNLTPILIDISNSFDKKIKNLTLYDSQIGFTEINASVLHGSRLSGRGLFERIWKKNQHL
jgi:LmbE family N-acetylglucosaminyl deacetylase